MLQAAPTGARLGWVSPVKIRGFPEDRSRATLNIIGQFLVTFLYAFLCCSLLSVPFLPYPFSHGKHIFTAGREAPIQVAKGSDWQAGTGAGRARAEGDGKPGTARRQSIVRSVSHGSHVISSAWRAAPAPPGRSQSFLPISRL